MKFPSCILLLAVRLGAGFAPNPSASAATSGPVDFNFHIRPLLSDRCFACHGPDDKARKADLDLHTREGALRGGKSKKPSINLADVDASELLRRLTTTDPDDRMPPPESKLPALNAEEIEQLRRWIAGGAEYKEHWAFLPLRPTAVPEIRPNAGIIRTDIDRFVLARLEAEGWTPQSEAPRETLIRRVTLDLTGLPPSTLEIDAFLADTSSNAYENVVDRLLRSARYGERMAQEWMDLSRFADTFGYQADVDIDLSPWRDWVIRSFNDNLPWNQFITWQLAGDLLPQATQDQRLATAFNRLHRQTNEGGSIDEEFRNEYVSDRVHTMGTAFLGLTLECGRCHDHKYDPFSQRDYYRLSAFFNSIDESGLYSHFTRATPTPVLLLWEDGAKKQHDAAMQAVADAEATLNTARLRARERFNDWLPAAPKSPILPKPVLHLAFESITNGRTTDAVSTNLALLHDGPQIAAGKVGQAMQFSGDNSATVPFAGKFGRTDRFSFGLWIRPTELQTRAVVFHASRSWTDSGSRGYELVLDGGRPSFALIHFWPGNAIAVRARDPLPLGAWSHLAVTYDGSSRANGIRLFLDGRPLELEIVRDHLYKDIQHRAEWGDSEAGAIPLTIAGRFRDNGFKNGFIDEFQAFDLDLTALEVSWLAQGTAAATPDWTSVEHRDRSLEYYSARHDEAFRSAATQLQQARAEENRVITPVREIMTMTDLPTPRPTFVLRRGAYDAPGEAVERGVPERIFPMPAGLPNDRLGLAQWLTHPQHPLTARVAVNRIWRLHFGRGLVATTWDFGAQGTLPSHPELLDWLARRFIDSGWNRKALHKEIVMSATYRQSSKAPGEFLARDPENRLLARGPRHRLDAEQIRDSALSASGLLVDKVGGSSVKPYQPAGVWEDAGTGKSYSQDKGEKLYRRSLYTFWRRTAPPPSMLTFDATSREVCTAKRETTTTPLQSLVLLNDPQFLEAARTLAERLLMDHPKDPAVRCREAFRRLTGRPPDDREIAVLDRLYREQSDYFRANPEAAMQYLGIGERPRNETLPPFDLAATAVLASAVMNHDEFVMKR
ncbi:MAG: DUF1553 domain-containing protein [Verrucomicrobiales bacterium]|nr:DUF1553 domain-containing protein [Verrucomicrobiales bacterium]